MSTQRPTPGSGRRIAPRTRRRPGRTALAGGAVVALAAGLLLASGAVEAEPARDDRNVAVPVDDVSVTCTAFPGSGPTEVLTLGAPLPGLADGGTLTAGPPGTPGQPVAQATRGPLQALDALESGSALTVAAAGDAAPGRAGFAVHRAAGAGSAAQDCLAPRARWWFTGGAATLDHTSTLVLANTDPGPAVVDVEVLGAAGPVESVGTRGVTLAPGEVRSFDLLDVAPQAEELAVHVEASRGRVVATLADRVATRPGLAPGPEWIPAQAEPSRVLRISPLPVSADRRILVVANPSQREALADLRIAGESGSFTPAEVPQLRVPPGSVVTADLTEVVVQEAAAVVVRSSVRLTGTVRSSVGSDVTYAAAAPSLTGPAAAVVPDGLAPGVHLSAAGTGGTARVVAYDEAGQEVDSVDLEIAPSLSVAWSPRSRAASVVVTPGEGRLFGGVVLTGPAGATQLPLRPLPVTLRRPVVVPVVR